MVRIFLALWLALTPAFAFAGSLTLLGAGQPPSGGVAPTLSFVSSGALSSSGSTRTAATVNIGNPAYIGTRRVIVVCTANSNANGPLVSATINGVTATIHVDYEPGSSNDWIRIFSAVVTSGTTNVTVTETFSGTQFAGDAYAVYNVDNSLLNSTTPTTGSNTSAAVGVTSLATSSISTQSGGFVVAGIAIDAASTGLAFTGLTTDAFGGTQTGAIGSQGSLAGGNITPTATWGSSQPASIAAAAWR